MELIMINAENSQVYPVDELAMLKTGLVFADKVTIVSPNFSDFLMYLKINSRSDKKTLTYYLDKLETSDREDKEKLALEGQTMYDEMVELRNFKYKDQEMIVHMQKLMQSFRDMKEGNSALEQEFLESENTWPLMNHYRNKSFVIIPNDTEGSAFTESIPDRLIKSFLRGEALHFFDDCFFDDTLAKDKKEQSFLYVDIFSIPDLDFLQDGQLRLMKNDFRDKFKNFNKAVSAMQKEFSTVLFKEENHETISLRTLEIMAPYTDFIRATVAENVYIHQVRNGSEEYATHTMNFCVADIAQIVGFYEQRKIITASETEYVLDAVQKRKDLSTCCFFFTLECATTKDVA